MAVGRDCKGRNNNVIAVSLDDPASSSLCRVLILNENAGDW